MTRMESRKHELWLEEYVYIKAFRLCFWFEFGHGRMGLCKTKRSCQC